jgi:hypothetical protein
MMPRVAGSHACRRTIKIGRPSRRIHHRDRVALEFRRFGANPCHQRSDHSRPGGVRIRSGNFFKRDPPQRDFAAAWGDDRKVEVSLADVYSCDGASGIELDAAGGGGW